PGRQAGRHGQPAQHQPEAELELWARRRNCRERGDFAGLLVLIAKQDSRRRGKGRLDRPLPGQPVSEAGGRRKGGRQDQLEQHQHPEGVADDRAESVAQDEVENKKRDNQHARLEPNGPREVSDTPRQVVQGCDGIHGLRWWVNPGLSAEQVAPSNQGPYGAPELVHYFFAAFFFFSLISASNSASSSASRSPVSNRHCTIGVSAPLKA